MICLAFILITGGGAIPLRISREYETGGSLFRLQKDLTVPGGMPTVSAIAVTVSPFALSVRIWCFCWSVMLKTPFTIKAMKTPFVERFFEKIADYFQRQNEPSTKDRCVTNNCTGLQIIK